MMEEMQNNCANCAFYSTITIMTEPIKRRFICHYHEIDDIKEPTLFVCDCHKQAKGGTSDDQSCIDDRSVSTGE